MRGAFRDVLEFHRHMGHRVGDLPEVPPIVTVNLRRSLINEEINELFDAIEEYDLPKIADGIADAIYVLIGTAIAYGIDLPEVWEAVRVANLAKAGGPVREDGKILRPPGWEPPDIAGVLAAQGRIEERYPRRRD